MACGYILTHSNRVKETDISSVSVDFKCRRFNGFRVHMQTFAFLAADMKAKRCSVRSRRANMRNQGEYFLVTTFVSEDCGQPPQCARGIRPAIGLRIAGDCLSRPA